MACWSSWSGCPPVTWEITGSSPVQAANNKKMAKKRSSIIDRILNDLTPEKLEEMKQRRLNAIKEMSVEFQLGCYVGDEIVRRFLPTLDVDMIQTNNLINVTPAEKAEAERLNDDWFEKSQSNQPCSAEWKKLRAYHRQLEDKYLQDFLECRISPVNVNDETEFKRGVAHSLWHSDLSHYACSSPNDIGMRLSSDAYFTVITLRRSKG